MNPSNVVANATESVKSAATQRVRDMAETASATAQQAIGYTRQRAREVVGTARQNSIPLALIGLGAAWLLTNRSRGGPQTSRNSGYFHSGEWHEEGAGLAARTGEYASQTADAVRRMGHRRQNQLQRMIAENPLLLGGRRAHARRGNRPRRFGDRPRKRMDGRRARPPNESCPGGRDTADQVQNTASSVADAAKKITG